MNIELNSDEAGLLKTILQKDLEETRVESHHTKNIAFKGDLHSRERILQGLIDRLPSGNA